eukprot:Sspe_Gene.23579::Locus_9168_Transcript_1_1_Confidence_1.000_Length_619::g.23579::m.23579
MATSGLKGFTMILIFLGAVGTMVGGGIHLHDNLKDPWCDSKTQKCVGRGLVWGEGDNEIRDNNGRNKWRSVFTFVPDAFFDLWTPFIMGFITLCAFFFASTRIHTITDTWVRALVWHALVMLCGAFGYAGNYGIVLGFYLAFVGLLCLFNVFLTKEKPQMDLGHYLPGRV